MNFGTFICNLRLVILLLLVFALYGCPNMVVTMIENSIPDDQEQKGKYRPVYINKSSTIEKIKEQLKARDSLIALGNDTSVTIPEVRIISSMQSVNDEEYPDSIRLRVIVHDANGRYLSGLAPPYYSEQGDYRKYWPSLRDSCRNQNVSIEDFNVKEVRQTDGIPYAISFVLDHSPSMGDTRSALLQKATKFLFGAIKEGDYVSLVKFSDKNTVEIPLTKDRRIFRTGVVVDGMGGGRYGSGTAMYDGVAEGAHQAESAPEHYRKVVVLFSDGGDNSSKINIDSLKLILKRKKVPVYSIAYGLASTKPLKELSEYTGGRFYQIFSSKEFPYVFYDIYVTLNNYYEISYTPPVCESIHKASVTVLLDKGIDEAYAEGYYDKSVFTEHDPVGTVAFMNIEFEFGRSDVKKESLPLIVQVSEAMKQYPEVKILIQGHTDNVGSEENNMKLSQERAKSVAGELIKSGIQAERLKTKGFGESMPLVSNDSDENRRRNRRTEFIIIEK